jgi:hypothetical protein
LSNNWLNQQGNFQVAGSQAKGLGGLNVAAVNGINSANVFVQADVNVPAGQFGGLVAHYGGPLDQNMYWAGLNYQGGLQAQIWRNLNGTWTELFGQSDVSSGVGTLRLEVVGTSLKLFDNNVLVAYANDTLVTGGTVGIRSTAMTTFSNFSAGVLSLTNPGLSFSDSFSTAVNQQLSSNWLNQQGNFQVTGGQAMGLGGGLMNVATMNGVSTVNSTVQATVTVAPGQFAGLVSRYTGPFDENMYWAGLEGGLGSAIAEIWVNVNGHWQLLAITGAPSNTGTLKLRTSGNLLQLYLNNNVTPLLTVTDNTITTAGTVGMRASAGATISNFSANSP